MLENIEIISQTIILIGNAYTLYKLFRKKEN